jgi:hypothetical protein
MTMACTTYPSWLSEYDWNLEDYTSLNAMQAQGMSLNYANPQLESAVYKEEPSQSRFSVLQST